MVDVIKLLVVAIILLEIICVLLICNFREKKAKKRVKNANETLKYILKALKRI